MIGFFGTLLLHSFVVHSVMGGSRAHKTRPPDVQSPGSTLDKADITPGESLILVDLVSGGVSEGRADLPIFVNMPTRMRPTPSIRLDPLPLLDLETLNAIGESESVGASDIGDGNDRARLVGIYSKQMIARVGRIWRRPRTPVNEGMDASKTVNAEEYFQCQAQIVQDSSGNVLEVLLPNCNGSPAWQRSLVTAIQQSSPLPAPPNPKVFTKSILLNFVGYAYAVGSSEDEYEIPAVRTARTDALR